ncbi:MAG: DEAD/DEAH box helicase [Myxococcaceae bacterium]|nr:DEAD/DEAH box helicase [Myxococcaceae bacterium]
MSAAANQSQIPLHFASHQAVVGHDALSSFHPIVQAWFHQTLGEPTAPQIQGWPVIRSGRDVLIAAPTGSGKTLTAFLACLDELFRLALRHELPDETRMLYVSPLKALGNDVQKNLLTPLYQLEERARAAGLQLQPIRVTVRSGDTPAHERAAMVKRPGHILITTPESLYLYLTAERSRKTLARVQTVVVDEIHALARDKRGSHFALSMERLKALCAKPIQCIGLSATQKPLDRLARFLTGAPRAGREACECVQVGHLRPWELTLETPEEELSAVATHEMWGQLYERLMVLSAENRTLLVFANTRRLAERVAHDLGERLGHDKVAAHHGSMSRELRLKAEDRLKAGQLKVMVATASLELGIDIGSIDLVVQLGSPRSIAVMLQRLGRSGHRKSAVSRGVLFALTRDELVESVALMRAVKEGTLDAVRMPDKPLDVLAQQLVAEVAAQEWDEDSLFDLVRRAMPYEDLKREEFEQVVSMLSEGVSTRRGRSRVHLHRDRVNGWLKPRKGARLAALQNGGAIPDTFIYPVIAEPEEKQVGTLDEDFAVESMAGDIFLLGSTSWRIQRIYDGQVRVEDAHGHAPTVPFWQGEAPARTDELSSEVGRLREDITRRDDAQHWLESEVGVSAKDADLLVRYVRAGTAALGAAPSQQVVVAERFFDEAGGMQLIIHAPFGGRINRAWGMALRKSFCRSFDFELQAAASDDGILLSLGEQHSFPLMDIFDFVSPNTAEQVLTQAVLQAPMFGTRFRWTSTRSLALSRLQSGKRVPPPIQRARAEDLLAAVFPAQVGCQDNHGGGDIEPPDHPLVNETLKDCLHDAMDIDGLKAVLAQLKDGRIRKVAVDLPEPSVLSHQMLNSAPYTYLDEAPLEERRARAVSVRRTLPAADAEQLGVLDAAAIAQVRQEAWPEFRDADELHDALLQLGILPVEEQAATWLGRLEESGRAAVVEWGGRAFAYAAERVPWVQALFPDEVLRLKPLPGDGAIDNETALERVVRGWMEVSGPVTSAHLAEVLALSPSAVEQALYRLEAVGQVIRGHFTSRARNETAVSSEETAPLEWCDRRLLQRIHRLTVGRLRKEIEPLSPQDFMRFLFRWHHLDAESKLRGPGGVNKVISLLQGYEAPAAAWEQELIPSRMKQYAGDWLEQASFHGDVAWGRLSTREVKPVVPLRRGSPVQVVGEAPEETAQTKTPAGRRSVPGRNASLTFVRRADLDWLLHAARPQALLSDGLVPLPEDFSPAARDVAQVLERRGASFFAELVSASRRLPTEVEDGLWELLARGWVTADAVQNLRVLLSPKLRKRQRVMQRGGPGRWSLLRPVEAFEESDRIERLARLFLQRYGVVFRDLLARESLAPTWRELLFVYRRMEARGEIRGGRFLSGMSGEQFALPEAVDMARAVRRSPKTSEVVRVAGVDPLNLTGVVTPGPRVAAVMGNEVVYVDGCQTLHVVVRGDEARPSGSDISAARYR